MLCIVESHAEGRWYVSIVSLLNTTLKIFEFLTKGAT